MVPINSSVTRGPHHIYTYIKCDRTETRTKFSIQFECEFRTMQLCFSFEKSCCGVAARFNERAGMPSPPPCRCRIEGCRRKGSISKRGLCEYHRGQRISSGGTKGGQARVRKGFGKMKTSMRKMRGKKGGKCRWWKARLITNGPMQPPDLTITELHDELLRIRERKKRGEKILSTNPILEHGWFESPARMDDFVSKEIITASEEFAGTKKWRPNAIRISTGVRFTQSHRGAAAELQESWDVCTYQYMNTFKG